MKKLSLVLAVLVAALALLTACDGSGEGEATTAAGVSASGVSQTDGTTSGETGVAPGMQTAPSPKLNENDDGTLTVSVPMDYLHLNGKTAEQYAADNNYISVKENSADMLYELTMTSERHEKCLSDIVAQFDKYTSEVLEGEGTAYVTSVEHSDDFGTVDILLDRETYNSENTTLMSVSFAGLGCAYKAFAGMELKTTVTVMYSDNNEVVSSYTLPVVVA